MQNFYRKMNGQPKLSIITINYNNATGLDRTIRSVLSQIESNIEYIVVDGASTDGSIDVLNKYRDKIDITISEPDNGIYNAMNKGTSVAKGDYLLFLNSGDVLFDKNTLLNCHIEKFKDDIICGRIYNSSPTKLFLNTPPRYVSLFTFVGGSLPHPSSFIKRILFEKIGGYIESYRVISDWCFFVDALIVNKCTYSTIDNIVAVFEYGGVSSSTSNTDDKYQFLIDRFGERIIEDYLPVNDEAIANTAFWVSSTSGIFGKLMRIPFKVFNRVLHLRNRLSRRLGTIKLK